VAINCAAIPKTLLESELFGFERGAFTGATQNKKGLFAQADKGSFFMDEISEMPISISEEIWAEHEESGYRVFCGSRSENDAAFLAG
jgi:transcriptional regulator with AAA-type ATPase domain